MAVSEQARLRLHQALEETLGNENAATLMDSLPPTRWGDLATKQDLERLATREEVAALRGDLQAGLAEVRGDLQAGLATLRAEFHHEMRVQLGTFLGANAALGGLFLAAAKLL